jgi:TolB-like protein
LAKIPGRRVAARTSSFAMRERQQDIRDIGDRLNVGALLEGSVRRAENRIRVTAQLINVADGYHLWSERYDREMVDVFAIQDEISQAIVGVLRVQLAPRSDASQLTPPLARRFTDNVEAYNLFLKAASA